MRTALSSQTALGPLRAALGALVVIALPMVRLAGQTTTVLNFDTPPLGSAVEIDATSYLSSFGIFLSAVTPGAQIFIIGQGAPGLPVATSGTNYFTESHGNNAETMTLNFAAALSSISFFRTAMTYDSKPQWTAEALDVNGNVISSVGEALTATGNVIAAQEFTLFGPDITALRINSDNQDFTNLSGVPIDDLTLTTEAPPVTATPEPASMTLVATGLAGMFGLVRRRRPASEAAGQCSPISMT